MNKYYKMNYNHKNHNEDELQSQESFDELDEQVLQDELQNMKQYDNNNKMFFHPGKAGPYFSNYTHFLLFIWVTKYQIDKISILFYIITKIKYFLIVRSVAKDLQLQSRPCNVRLSRRVYGQ